MKGKKVTERYDHRITMRVSTSEWLKIIIKAEKESLPPSTWIRKQIKEII